MSFLDSIFGGRTSNWCKIERFEHKHMLGMEKIYDRLNSSTVVIIDTDDPALNNILVQQCFQIMREYYEDEETDKEMQ